MNPFWYRILFRKVGKPRRLARAILFRKNRTPRSVFYRVVYKKNGAVRPQWTYWVADTSPRSTASTYTVDQPDVGTLSAAEQTLRQLRSFDKMVADWRRSSTLPELLSPDSILKLLLASTPTDLVLAASHDNYRDVPGGVQLCIQREEQAAIANGLTYLQFHPWQPLPCLADIGDSSALPVTMLLNGTLIGTASMSALTEAVDQLVVAGRQVRLIIHHLLGHSPEALTALALTAQVREVPVWLHDFFTLCPSYTLQRNNLAFCAAPDVDSNACRICVFGSARAQHRRRIENLFQSLPVVAVAPSQVTADFWLAKAKLPVHGFAVIPHVVLDKKPRTNPTTIDQNAPITVGYLGGAVTHKGWPVFNEIMHRSSGQKMRFVVLSGKRPSLGEDDWQYVHVTTEAIDAMSQAVARAKVDVVLHWATWPETFSFTTFEALSAGAWVLTNPLSGNVQATVQASGHGIVLDDLTALDQFFSDGDLEQLVAERRAEAARTEITARYSALSFDLPGWS